MHNFCTLFDSNYLPRALVMYHSLVATGERFTLYVVCFDDLALEVLKKLKLPNLIEIPLGDFESKELLAVKNTRTTGEYCWTCTAHVIRYVIDTYKLPQVTYLDADLCFYNKPSIILEEFNQSGGSVLITEHRYTARYNQSATSGIYCVQFMTFNADKRGLEVLQWWQDRCLEWCFSRVENGKFGDQKYLDDWTERFEGIHVLQHLGGGVAPWNIQQYKLSYKGTDCYVNDYLLVFYHYHSYKYYSDGKHSCASSYYLNKDVINLLYDPYRFALLNVHEEIRNVMPDFNSGWNKRDSHWVAIAKYIKERLKNILVLKRVLKGIFNEN
jgi:hypothetical protein